MIFKWGPVFKWIFKWSPNSILLSLDLIYVHHFLRTFALSFLDLGKPSGNCLHEITCPWTTIAALLTKQLPLPQTTTEKKPCDHCEG